MSTQGAGAVDGPATGPRERKTEQVARRLRGLLAEQRISGSRLAELTGMTQSTVSRRLTGTHPFDLDELDLVCDVLGITVEDLLLGTRVGPRPDGPDGGLHVRHQGLEPRTRWFGVDRRGRGRDVSAPTVLPVAA